MFHIRQIFLLLVCLMIGHSATAEIVTSDQLHQQKIDTLLQQVRELRGLDDEVNKERETEFLESRNQQHQLLQKAQAENKRLQAESEGLEKQFSDNEVELARLSVIHEQRVGDFVELSGVMRQTAADLEVQLSNSVLGLHMSGWRDYLTQLKTSKKIPSLGEIELLWEIFLQQLTLQGQSIRFTTDVLHTDGKFKEREVMNIGPFATISDGSFLMYLANSGKLATITRQPARQYLQAAKSYEDAKEGIVAAPIDPSRGVLLSILLHKPDWYEYIQQGGVIAAIIIFIAMLGILLGIVRAVSLLRIGRSIDEQITHLHAIDTNLLGNLLTLYKENIHLKTEALELKMDEFIIDALSGLQRGLSALKVMAAIAPLLGLLGTVTGMIETFQAITLFGTGNPKLMAGGISQALVTTALGLIAAIPIILLYTYAHAKSRSLRDVLEKHSVGLLATHVKDNAVH